MIAWLLDELLDRVPRREGGRLYRYGQWGCSLGLPGYWAQTGRPGPEGQARGECG